MQSNAIYKFVHHSFQNDKSNILINKQRKIIRFIIPQPIFSYGLARIFDTIWSAVTKFGYVRRCPCIIAWTAVRLLQILRYEPVSFVAVSVWFLFYFPFWFSRFFLFCLFPVSYWFNDSHFSSFDISFIYSIFLYNYLIRF